MLKLQRTQDLNELIPPAHAELSIASFFRSAPVRGSVVNLLIHLADQLIRGFQSANDQFQALQTQVTEGFQSMDSLLQELEAEVAQIQIPRNTLRHLMPEDQWDLVPWGFSFLFSIVLIYNFIIWATFR
jgi:hypothetical protein